MNPEKKLTREEWREIAEKLGASADQVEALIAQIMEYQAKMEELAQEMREPEEELCEALRRWKEHEEMLRLAIGAVLWVSENAADKVRFMMLDSHPPDRNCRQIRERGAH